jgi:signal transduction histidine kinase
MGRKRTGARKHLYFYIASLILLTSLGCATSEKTIERIEVEVAILKPSEGGVQVSVTDTGPGIPAENLTTIFDKFQQATPAGSYQSKGTGLGLAIVKHIITSHGGKIWAESEPGQGSTFIFVLPI